MTEVKETPEQIAVRLLRNDFRRFVGIQRRLRKRLLGHAKRLDAVQREKLRARLQLEHDTTMRLLDATAPGSDPTEDVL